jgi:hypothetical protein
MIFFIYSKKFTNGVIIYSKQPFSHRAILYRQIIQIALYIASEKGIGQIEMSIDNCLRQ